MGWGCWTTCKQCSFILSRQILKNGAKKNEVYPFGLLTSRYCPPARACFILLVVDDSCVLARGARQSRSMHTTLFTFLSGGELPFPSKQQNKTLYGRLCRCLRSSPRRTLCSSSHSRCWPNTHDGTMNSHKLSSSVCLRFMYLLVLLCVFSALGENGLTGLPALVFDGLDALQTL